MRWKQAFAIAALGCVTACSGGGSSGGSGSVAAPAPAPTPTPTPTPTPAATRYQIESAGPVVGEIRFYRSAVVAPASTDYAALNSDRDGVVYYRNPTAIVAPFSPVNFVDDGLNYALSTYGIDRVSGLPMGLRAPLGASLVSPVTTLLYAIGDQAVTKHALQFDGLFQLANPDRDLRTFSWVRAQASANADDTTDARRIRAANVRLFAYVAAVEQFRAGPGISTFYFSPYADPTDLGTVIKANPRVELFTAGGTETVLRAILRYPNNPVPYRDDVIAAAAQLIARYAVAVGPVVSDDDVAAAYMLGTHGYLRRTLWELTSANSAAAAARVQAITVSDITQAVAPFAERVPFSTTLLFPHPDFIYLAPGGTTTIPYYDPFSNGSPALANFDSIWFIHQNNYPLTLKGVTVPARFAAAISATAQADQSVTVQAKPGFTGVAWFDYDEQTPGGITGTGRAYVIVK